MFMVFTGDAFEIHPPIKCTHESVATSHTISENIEADISIPCALWKESAILLEI